MNDTERPKATVENEYVEGHARKKKKQGGDDDRLQRCDNLTLIEDE